MTTATEQPKYLAIKNWDAFQSSRTAKPMPWLRDYSDQVADPDYSRLTAYQRCILQECRRLRQRLGSNVPYEPQYIASAASLLPRDRINLTPALHHLVTRGFLIPTNQQHGSVEEIRGEEKKEDKRRGEPVKLPVGWILKDGQARQEGAR